MDLMELWARGLMTEGLGPDQEWTPVPVVQHRERHDTFWQLVTAILVAEPGEYDDLPEYFTEVATHALEANI